MTHKLKKILLVVLSSGIFVGSLLGLILAENKGREGLKMATDLINVPFTGENYYLTPANLDFSTFGLVNYPFAKKRPFSLLGYFREFIKDGRKFSDINKNWLYLSSKRVSIVQYSGAKFEILNNYKDIGQFEDWEKDKEPKSWEFWNYSKVDTWEGSLEELFFVLKKRAANINEAKIAKYRKIDQLVELAGVVSQHQKRLDWIIGDLPRTEEERKYLLGISRDIFKNISEEIGKNLPVYEQGVFQYSVKQVIENRNYGVYDIWIDTNWLGNEEKTTFSVEIKDFGFSVRKEVFEAKNRYGIKVGKIGIKEGMDDLVLVLRILGLKGPIDKSPKIWVKKVANFPGEEPKIAFEKTGKNSYKVLLKNVSLEKERRFFNSKDFGWRVIRKKYLENNVVEVLLKNQLGKFWVILSLVFFLNLLFFLKSLIVSPKSANTFYLRGFFQLLRMIIANLLIGVFSLNVRYSFLFVYLLIIGLFFAGKDASQYSVMIFVFWILNSFIWNLDSRFSYIIALFLLLPCPVILFLKKEYIAETLAILSFFFLLSGAARQHSENTCPDSEKTDWNKFRVMIINNFFGVIFLGIFSVIYLFTKRELAFYKDFFRQNYLREFLGKLPIKIFLVWFLFYLVLVTIFKFYEKLFVKKIKLKKEYQLKKRLFFILLLLSLLAGEKIVFCDSRKAIMHKPYILGITPSAAKMGEEVKIYGHNFVDLPVENGGWVFLDGVEQTIKKWKNEEIVFLVADEFSNTGLLNISNMYGGKLIKSNSVEFEYIDTVKSEEPE